MFVNQVDHFLTRATVSRGPVSEEGRGTHVAFDVVGQLIPPICGAAVVLAALLVRFADEAFGIAGDQTFEATLGIAGVGAALTYGIFRHSKVLKRSKTEFGAIDGRATISAIALVALSIAALLMLLGIGERYSLRFMALWLSTGTMMIFAAASLYERLVARKGRLTQRVAIFGDGKSAAKVARLLLDRDTSCSAVKIFGDVATDDKETPRGGLDELVEYARSGGCDRIIVVMGKGDQERTKSILTRLEATGLDVEFYAGCVPGDFMVYGAVAHGPLLLANVQRRPLDAGEIIIKGMMDYVLATIAIVAIAPLMILIALAIKLDSRGPVLFRQGRTGRRGIVNVIKFRTMNVLENGSFIVQARRDDPRITRVGRFLRRTSLDELPQLFNVLRGELSLVGPRPHAVAHDKLYGGLIPEYNNRAKVKPGITGYAQVSGLRSETSDPEMMRMRVKYDLYYIDHWSPWFDVKILFRTIGVVFWDRRAY